MLYNAEKLLSALLGDGGISFLQKLRSSYSVLEAVLFTAGAYLMWVIRSGLCQIKLF